MKNIQLLFVSLVVLFAIVVGSFFVFTGFQKRGDIVLTDFSVSENNHILKLNVGVVNSMGYIRDMKVKQSGNELYATFYSTFGGFNSKIGAKNQFFIPTNEDCNAIYFYSDTGEYILQLVKDAATDQWKK